MSPKRIQYAILVVVLGAIAVFAFRSSTHGDIIPLVISGQPAPGTANGVITGVRQASINAKGDTAFYTSLSVGGAASAGIFAIVGGAISPVALEGQAVPGATNLFFGGAFSDPEINDNDAILFTSNYASDASGTNSGGGMFLYTAGALREVVDASAAAPGTAGLTFGSFVSSLINDNGDIAFVANGSGYTGSGAAGLYLIPNGSATPTLLQAGVNSAIAMNNHDQIVFQSTTGIVEYSGGTIQQIAGPGNGLPSTDQASQPWINDDGAIVFVDSTPVSGLGRGGTTTQEPNAIYLWSQGAFTKIAATGDAVPGYAGSTFRQSTFSNPVINESGIVFSASTAPVAGQNIVWLICRYQNGQLSVIARGDQVVPDIGALSSLGATNFDDQSGPIVTFVANPGPTVTPPIPEGVYQVTPGPYTLMLPQIADGTATGSDWRTTFILANQSPTASTAVVSFYTDAGSPMSISIGGQVQTQMTVTVPAQGVAQFETDGLGAVQTGWAKVQADQVLSGIALFSFYDGSGNFIDEAGDSAASPFQSLSVFVQSDSSTSTGIALANPYTNASTVTLTLTDANSNQLAQTTVTLPAMGHLARYANELFSAIPSGEFDGKINVSGTNPVIALTLRQRGTAFTSLPIIP